MLDSVQLSTIILVYIIACIVILYRFPSRSAAIIMVSILIILLGIEQKNRVLMVCLIVLGICITVYETFGHKSNLKDSSITNPASWK